ncbi:MAG: hypothetical protein KAH12_02570 [Anaerolineales bacterium]|nr:hypothetical protein [Anaerolineales bacterium]
MKRSLPVVLMLFLVVLLGASCAAGNPSVPDAVLEESAAGEAVEQPLNLDYYFEMSAQVDGLVADMAYDQLKSEWVGDFSVDPEGLIKGDGMVTYDALVFAVNEELCGYAWTEKGTVVFTMSGRVHNQGGEDSYPVKIFLLDVEPYSLSDPEATCTDPAGFLKDTPPIYIEIHRDALLSTVLTHLHQNVGDQIRLAQELAVESSTVEYQILVSLALVELD